VSVYFEQGEGGKSGGSTSIVGSSRGAVFVRDPSRLEGGLAISAFAAAGFRGRVKIGEAAEELDDLDEIFVGGPNLRLRISDDGELRLYGQARHVVINESVMWRSMGDFVPSELWAAMLSSIVTLLVAVPLVRTGGRSGDPGDES
jgi:hypothetical protein